MFKLSLPWIFLLLPLPYMICKYLPAKKNIPTTSLVVPFYTRLLKYLQISPSNFTSPPIWLYLAWFFILMALSGPHYVSDPTPLTREGRQIMLALDISGSMAIEDMEVQHQRYPRLAIVKYAAETFVKKRMNDKIGLILFGSRPYLFTPLTHDKQHILSRLEDATVGLAGQATAIGDAIGLAVKHFKNMPQQGRIIILLTDGVNNAGVLSPQKAAEIAKIEQIKIYTIGLGSDARIANPWTGFTPPNMELDEKTLQTIADSTHGRYFKATNLQSLEEIYRIINQTETIKQDTAKIRSEKNYYDWPLAIALFIFLFGCFFEQRKKIS